MTDRQIEALRYVQAVRGRLFNQLQAPFPSEKAARRWLEQESAAGQDAEYEKRRQQIPTVWEELKESFLEAVERLPESFELNLGIAQVHVSYQAIDGSPRRVPATKPLLQDLAKTARYIAQYLNCLEGAAAMFILTGRDPQPVRGRRRTGRNPVGGFDHSERIEADQRGAKPPSETLRRQGPSPKQQRLYEIVERLIADEGRTPPEPPGRHGIDRGVRAYWEEIVRLFNAQVDPSWHYAHWTSAKRAYESAARKIEMHGGGDDA